MSTIDRKKPESLQHQLYITLKEWFVNEFSITDALPTEMAIAEKYKISQGTVRIALDNLVKEGLIVRTPGRGTFLNPRYYINIKSYRIGVILSEIDFFTNSIWEYAWINHLEIINGIMKSNIEYNVSSELISENHFSAEDNSRFDGFIVWPYVHDDLMKLLDKPHVLMNYAMDMLNGFSMIAEELVAKGYREIAYIGFTSGERINTINRILKTNKCGIIKPENIFECGGNPNEAHRSCMELLKRNRNVDCIVCSTDLRAQGVVQYLHELKIEIPDSISVYGFNGTRKNNRIKPSLTTCSFDWTFPGIFSVKQLRAILDKMPPPEYIPPTGRLIIRESTRKT